MGSIDGGTKIGHLQRKHEEEYTFVTKHGFSPLKKCEAVQANSFMVTFFNYNGPLLVLLEFLERNITIYEGTE